MPPIRPVEKAMRVTLAIAALACLVLVGCSGKKKDEVKLVDPPMSDIEKIDKVEKATRDATDIAVKNMGDIVPEGTKGWKASSANFEELGAKVDERLANAQDVRIEATLTYNDPTVGQMVFKPEIRIKDAKTFDVYYAVPDSKESTIWVRADGKRRAMNMDATWKELPGTDKPGPRLSEKDVEAFPRRFPELMFGRLTEGRDVWGPLFEAWKDGVAGYKVFFEEQDLKIGGKVRKIYRLVANTEKGLPAEVEVTIDANALRPTSIRSEGTLENGEKYKILWTGGWQTGGTFDRSKFKLPAKLPQPDQGT